MKRKQPRVHISDTRITGTLTKLPDGRLAIAGRVERKEAPHVVAWPWPLFTVRGENESEGER